MKKYKILGFLDETGAKYHRVYLALKDLQGKVIKLGEEEREINVKFKTCKTNEQFLTEDEAKDIDLLYINWMLSTPDIDISKLKSKYGFKYIVDVDDIWDDNTHLYFNPDWEFFITRNIILADYIVTTNNYLAAKVFQYNENVAIIPNLLPLFEQFKGKPEEKKFNGKLRIGLYGSFSHLNDFKLFKPILNRLANNKNIVQNCEFVLAGVNHPEIIEMFKKKKNITLKIIPPKSIENYMELLDDVDVICQPLVKSPHNFAKSGLKIIEGSIKDCILLGSELYENKEFTSFFKCETPMEYEKTIEMLLEEGNYEKFLQHTKEENLKENKYEERVKFTLELIEKVSNIVYNNELKDVGITTIVYNGEIQPSEYKVYDNSNIKTIEQKSYLFEYNVLNKIVPEFEDDKYYGIFSYKFPQKTGIFKKLLFELLKRNNYQEYDVIGLCQKLHTPYLQFTEKAHPGFIELFTLICNDLNLVVKEPKNVIYSNFFVAKGNIYKEYLNKIVFPAIELMETKYKDLAWKNANYISGLKGEALKQQTGLDFYPFHSFILERLLSVWIENNNMYSSDINGNIKCKMIF